MQRLLCILCCFVVLFTACGAPAASISGVPEPQTLEGTLSADFIPPYIAAVSAVQLRGQLLAQPAAYTPSHSLEPEEIVYAYFEQQYNAYTSLRHIDLSSIMDTAEQNNRNALVWQQMLVQRRRLVQEHGFAHVETTQFPYEINFISENELEDNRMSVWKRSGLIKQRDIALHFVITGTPGKAYPPVFSVNGQHTIRMHRVGGEWMIKSHYYPGSTRRFAWNEESKLPSDAEVLAQLRKQFADVTAPAAPAAPAGALRYNAADAVSYAKSYAEKHNPNFYEVGDWMGNCMNYVSQCIWYGFGANDGKMTKQWFAGTGGGSSAWENVNAFWRYASGGNGMRVQELDGFEAMEVGDILLTRAPIAKSSEDYGHVLILVDKENYIFAQNSPDALVYASDFATQHMRYIRMLYLE